MDKNNTHDHSCTRGHCHGHRHHEHHHEHGASRVVAARILLCAMALIAMQFVPVDGWVRLACFVAIYLIIGWDVVREAIVNILHGEVFDENFLMVVATLGAFALAIIEGTGDYNEAIAVMLFFQIGEYFQNYAVGKSHESIAELMGNTAMAGHEADSESAPEAFITRFARWYTPVVCYCALALAVIPPVYQMLAEGDAVTGYFGIWFYRALTFLVISCPCALVISIPLSFFAAIGGASRRGIFIKGCNIVEALAKTDRVEEERLGSHGHGATLSSHLLKVGNVQIAMGKQGGADAIAAADVVVVDADVSKVSTAVRLSRKCLGIVWQNIVFAIGIKVVCLVLSAFGITNMWLAVFADVGVLVLAVLNAMRARVVG